MKYSFIAALTLSSTVALAAPLDVFHDCDDCPEMIELPLGEFMMGAPQNEFRRNLVFRDGAFHQATPEHPHVKTDEGPQHRVTIDISIAMGRNEVTYDEWMACVNDGGCGGYVPKTEVLVHGTLGAAALRRGDGGIASLSGDHPVLFVSYQDMLSYVEWLNNRLGTSSYRLPTEAEWEYAARAGTTTPFAQGDTISSTQGNFSGELTHFVMMIPQPHLITRGVPVVVHELDAANPWGLRHMSGNAGELTLSCYTKRYAGWPTAREWLVHSNPETNCERVVRGGDYRSSIDLLRVAWRSDVNGRYRLRDLGFRIVKELD